MKKTNRPYEKEIMLNHCDTTTRIISNIETRIELLSKETQTITNNLNNMSDSIDEALLELDNIKKRLEILKGKYEN